MFALATVKLYLNGVTMGCGNPAPVGGVRGQVVGWSASAVRRHTRWLYSVSAPALDGHGFAVTLTMRDTPATSDEWRNALKRFKQRLRELPLVRWHWVVEWQRRGTPHVHMAVYCSDPAAVYAVVRAWLAVTADWGSSPAGQHVGPITGAAGWLEYLSKHAARGVRHYQRCGRPAGWTTTGRLWGYGGSWPVEAPLEASLTSAEYWAYRRSVRRYAVAAARSRALQGGSWRPVTYTRRMLSCPERRLSSVRGVSGWVPQSVALALLPV